MSDTSVSLDKVVRAFLKIREAKTANKQAFEAREAALNEQLETLENYMLNYTNQLGIDSFKTAHGTVFRTTEIIPSASDWDAFYEWIAENDGFDALERRIKKTFISTYMETNDGKLPPGVQVFQRNKINVRRSNKGV